MDTAPLPLPDAIQWSEGMLLSPQHFQQSDIYWNAHLHHRLSLLTPNFWGIGQLSLDPSLLKAGRIRVVSLEAVMPDGLAVAFPDENAPRSLELDVNEALNKGGPVRVHLVVPKRGASAATLGSPVQRYDALPGALTVDENTGEGGVEVERLRPRIELAVDPVPPRYCACPLLEVTRGGDRQVSLTVYHPPLTRLSASDFLGEAGLKRRMERLLDALWAKVRELAALHEGGQDEDAFTAESRRLLTTARAIAASLPGLGIAARDAGGHPETLYRALAAMVGQCSAIGGNPLPLQMEPYHHADAGPLFNAAIGFIEDRLASINTAYERLPFASLAIKGEHRFSRRLFDEMGKEFIIELKPRSGQSLAELTRWLNGARIAGDETLLVELKKRRLPGALVTPLTPLEATDRNLPPEAFLFSVKNQDIELAGQKVVKAFRAGKSLNILGDEEQHQPLEILLYRFKADLDATAGGKTDGGGGHG